MKAAWLTGNALAFDTETTGADPVTARIVTACATEVGMGGAVERGAWLVNPGVEIPAGAVAIHGITTEVARADGMEPGLAATQIAAILELCWKAGLPLVAMNATYDLSVLQAELARYGSPPLKVGPVLDPLVIDRGCDRYRKGKRTLTALAAHYGVKQGEAHSSAGDAITAARIVWVQARLYSDIAKFSLEHMQQWQAGAHAAWAINFQEHLRSKGDETAVISTDWPVRLAA